MLALHTRVETPRGPGTIAGREQLPMGGIIYRVRHPGGDVKAYANAVVRLAVEPARVVGPRLATVNGVNV